MTGLAPTVFRHAGPGLASRTRVLDAPPGVDPLDALGPGGFAWFTDGFALATSGVAARLGAADAAGVLAGIAGDDPLGLPGTGPLAVGPLGFDGLGELVIPARIVGRTATGLAWVTEVGPSDLAAGAWPSAPVSPAHDRPDRQAWTAAVDDALARIAAGRLEKVVLARQITVDMDSALDPATVVDRLRRDQPTCFTCAAGSYVGASPELLVRRRGRRVVSRPLAGTVAQGGSAGDDQRLVAAMAASAKEQAEHRLVVDAVRATLAGSCDDVSAAGPDVVRLATVAHLATTITGRLRDPAVSAVALAAMLHPTPAVAGVPRAAALAAIAELEDFDRGLYAGPVGWVDARGDGDWALALRGATLGRGRARLVAGAGIVTGSDPDAEWIETEAKLAAMRSVLAVGEVG